MRTARSASSLVPLPLDGYDVTRGGCRVACPARSRSGAARRRDVAPRRNCDGGRRSGRAAHSGKVDRTPARRATEGYFGTPGRLRSTRPAPAPCSPPRSRQGNAPPPPDGGRACQTRITICARHSYYLRTHFGKLNFRSPIWCFMLSMLQCCDTCRTHSRPIYANPTNCIHQYIDQNNGVRRYTTRKFRCAVVVIQTLRVQTSCRVPTYMYMYCGQETDFLCSSPRS